MRAQIFNKVQPIQAGKHAVFGRSDYKNKVLILKMNLTVTNFATNAKYAFGFRKNMLCYMINHENTHAVAADSDFWLKTRGTDIWKDALLKKFYNKVYLKRI